jgi:hypothetical protein
MKLQMTFDVAFSHAEKSIDLYTFLSSFLKKKLRSEWRKNFYRAHISPWAQKDGLLRLIGSKVLIVGTQSGIGSFFHDKAQYEEMLLRSRSCPLDWSDQNFS